MTRRPSTPALVVLALTWATTAIAADFGLDMPEPARPAIVEPFTPPPGHGPDRLRATLDDLSVPALPPVPAAGLDVLRTGSLRVPAEPPPAPVVIGAEDLLRGGLEVRLADPHLPFPARLARRDRDAVAAFYKGREFRPLWIRDGAWTAAARALAERLARADEDGLDPADYPVPSPRAGPSASSLDLAEAELKLAAAAYLYARDARGGRLDPSRVSALVTPKLDLPAPAAVLDGLAAARDPGAILAAYNPAYPGYRALRDKLASLRAARPGPPVARAPARPVRTTQAIAVLGDVEAPVSDLPSTFPNPRLEGDIVANMERWRWLPAAVAERYVAVNIPEFRLRLVANGATEHEARVITGKPDSPTPVFSGLMDHAVVNPSWYIPPSIMKKEILPGLARDPDYARKRGYEVVRRGSAVSVRQPPGERNALGFVKFMFPNNHAVYLHDTPNRSLFGSSRRAFSHGCVRVDQPFQFADFVLGKMWTEERLKRLIGRGERRIDLPEKLPVHLTYFTVSVDASGGVQTFEDLYGHHRRVRQLLGLGA